MSQYSSDIWEPRYKDSLKSVFIFEVKSFLGRILKSRAAPSSGKYLNLGCGTNYYDDFVNADFYCGFKFWRKGSDGINWQLDFRHKLICQDNRWSGVFTEHVLEHLCHDDVKSLLRELKRTMVQGATIRIIVPDLEQCCQDYCDKNFKGGETGARLIWGLAQNWGHRSLWDFELMAEALQETGFNDVQKCEFGKGRVNQLLQDSPHRKERSLCIEARS